MVPLPIYEPNDAKTSGKWQEDLIDSCLDHKFQNELFASILTIGQYKPSDESESDSKGKDGRGSTYNHFQLIDFFISFTILFIRSGEEMLLGPYQ